MARPHSPSLSLTLLNVILSKVITVAGAHELRSDRTQFSGAFKFLGFFRYRNIEITRSC